MVCISRIKQFIKKFKIDKTSLFHVLVSSLFVLECSNIICYNNKYYNPNIFVYVFIEVESF
jgi:uncharacterized membrane protein